MGRFDPKYTDEQREAIASAMNDRGMSAPEAVRAAAEGLDGLEPFTMPESTARDVASVARRQPTQPGADYAAQLRSFQGRGFTLIEQEMTKVEERQKQGDLSNSDWTRLTKLSRFARALSDLHVTPRSPQPVGYQGSPAHEDVMASLESALRERQSDAANGNGDDRASDELS